MFQSIWMSHPFLNPSKVLASMISDYVFHSLIMNCIQMYFLSPVSNLLPFNFIDSLSFLWKERVKNSTKLTFSISYIILHISVMWSFILPLSKLSIPNFFQFLFTWKYFHVSNNLYHLSVKPLLFSVISFFKLSD